jgi:hypothetical protein
VEKFISILFESCEQRPAVIGIDKSDAERNGVERAVKADQLCWNGGVQIKAFIQLCE